MEEKFSFRSLERKEEIIPEVVTVGIILRRARNARNITIEKAEKDTKIRGTYLRALEADEYDALPGETFLKGMIRSYGNYLGLDGTELVQQYKESQTGQSREYQSSRGIREAESVRMNVQLKTRRDIGSGKSGSFLKNLDKKQIAMGIGVILAIGLIFWTVSKIVSMMGAAK